MTASEIPLVISKLHGILQTKFSNMVSTWGTLSMPFRFYSLTLGGSLGKDAPNFSRCVLIQSTVEGVALTERSLYYDLLKFDPHLGGNFEVFLRKTHSHSLFLDKSLSDTLLNIHWLL